jgi:hypothetical protein
MLDASWYCRVKAAPILFFRVTSLVLALRLLYWWYREREDGMSCVCVLLLPEQDEGDEDRNWRKIERRAEDDRLEHVPYLTQIRTRAVNTNKQQCPIQPDQIHHHDDVRLGPELVLGYRHVLDFELAVAYVCTR